MADASAEVQNLLTWCRVRSILGKMTPSPAQTPSPKSSTSSPPRPLSLDDLSETELKLLEITWLGFTMAALARLEGIDADYFESEEQEKLVPYMKLYEQRYMLPSVVG